MNPFDYLNSINQTKEDIMTDDIAEKGYNGFMVNRGLSYFQDTILIANEMNTNGHLENKLQYDFLRHLVRKKRRFSKWNKPEVIENVDIIKEFYGYSDDKARQVIDLFSKDDIEDMKSKMFKGGKR